MIHRLVRGAIRLHPLQLALLVLSTAMGSGISAALGSVSLQAQDRIARELRSFGANVVVEPLAAAAPAGAPAADVTLAEVDLNRVLTIFWRHNVVGLAPSLTAVGTVSSGERSQRALVAGVWFERRIARADGGEELAAGIVPLFPYWKLDGRWPAPGERGAAVLGGSIAARLGVRAGARVELEVRGARGTFEVAGVLASGGLEEEQVLLDLAAAQELLGAPGRVSRALVSAVTVPLDAFGRREPAGMTKREFEKWFCTPYVTSVARQIEEAVPGSRARPVWSLAEAEARVLSRLGVLMALLAAVALGAAALAVASTFAARLTARRAEIALIRATGASARHVVVLLGSEIAATAGVGGILGALLASALVRVLGAVVFGAPMAPGPGVAPLAIAGALLVGAAGAAWPIRRALTLDPAPELKEAA